MPITFLAGANTGLDSGVLLYKERLTPNTIVAISMRNAG
jgi:hypothetical protein